MSLRLLNLLALLVLAALLALNGVAVVPEGQRGVLLHLGEPRRIGLAPGLYWRLPLLEELQLVDVRTQVSDLPPAEYRDAQHNAMLVDAWVLWRVRDLPRYYLRTGGESAAAVELLQPVVQESMQRALASAAWPENRAGLPPLLRQGIVAESSVRLRRELGVEVLDVGLRRLALPPAVKEVVLQRMRLERESKALALRAEAAARQAERAAAASREREALLAAARRQALERRLAGEAEAGAVLAAARAQDPVFFRYWQALETWRHGFGKPGDVLVLAADSELQAYRKKYFLDAPARPAPGVQP